MVNYKEELDKAIQLTLAKGYEQTRAEWLFLDIFHWSRTDYVVHMYDEMPKSEVMKFNLALQRMLLGEPIQYIVGFQSFFGRQFEVNTNCLIPRPETEEVMLYFLKRLNSYDTIADIGTGSGALAITLKKENETLDIYATDIVLETLHLAQANAEKLEADIHFLQGDALQPLIKEGIKLNGLISNPPYIAESDKAMMDTTVIKYEPHQALFAEDDGYAIYASILEDLPLVMLPDSLIVFEIGYNQGKTLQQMINRRYPDKQVEIIQDINGLDRIVSFRW